GGLLGDLPHRLLGGGLLHGLLGGLLGRFLRSFLGSHGQLLVSWLGLPSHKSQRHRHGIIPVTHRRPARGRAGGWEPARGGAGKKNTRAVTGPGAGFGGMAIGGGGFRGGMSSHARYFGDRGDVSICSPRFQFALDHSLPRLTCAGRKLITGFSDVNNLAENFSSPGGGTTAPNDRNDDSEDRFGSARQNRLRKKTPGKTLPNAIVHACVERGDAFAPAFAERLPTPSARPEKNCADGPVRAPEPGKLRGIRTARERSPDTRPMHPAGTGRRHRRAETTPAARGGRQQQPDGRRTRQLPSSSTRAA